MKLWIDDVRPIPIGYDTWAKTAEEAIEFLETGIVTHVSFDHDLGMEVYGVNGEIYTSNEHKDAKSGYDVALWVERQAYLGEIPRFVWRIHSANPVGAEKIRKAMINAERFWKNAKET